MPRISRDEAVNRLLKFVNTGTYGLGKGDKNALADSPFEFVASAPGPSTAKNQCDCIGAVLWAFASPRHVPLFPEYEGDINVDSALMDAGCIKGDHSLRKFFVEQPIGEPGDILMFPSVRAGELGDTSVPASTRIRIGHTGLITGSMTKNRDPNYYIANFSVLECSSGTPAVKHGWDANFHGQNNRANVTWKGNVHTNHSWRTRIVRYVGP